MKSLLPIIILMVSFICTPSVLRANHFIGGEVYYKILSKKDNTNLYEILFQFYSDCDPKKAGSVMPTSVPIFIVTKETGKTLMKITLQRNSLDKVKQPDCMDINKTCIQKGVFRTVQELPILDETIVFLYSDCCRSGLIENIFAPNGYGFTFYTEITPYAQRQSDASPQFINDPLTIVCRDNDINYHHAALDADADSLVYYFDTPKAKTIETELVVNGQSTQVIFKRFDKECYMLDTPLVCANYIKFDPRFASLTYPLGGTIEVDRRTGRMSGRPDKGGNFLYSLVVESYRQGKLMGRIARDVEFFINICDFQINAKVESDTIINKKTFVLINCNDKTISIKNKSNDTNYIQNIIYKIPINGEIATNRTWNWDLTFPDTGFYKGMLILNEGKTCTDTAFLEFRIYNRLKPDFEFSYDSCQNQSILFKDKTTVAEGSVKSWLWQLNGKDSVFTQNANYLLRKTGKNLVKLTVKDNLGCIKKLEKTVNWYPSTEVSFKANLPILCSPVDFKIQNTSTPLDSQYTFKWYFSDGGFRDGISPNYTFKDGGKYNVRVESNSPIGCKSTKFFEQSFEVKQGVKAQFTHTPQYLNPSQAIATFKDISQNADFRDWYWNGRPFSKNKEPIFTFRDTGLQRITLMVASKNGCRDSLSRYIDVEPMPFYTLPNAFSPNNDGVNDVYKGVALFNYIKQFHLTILDRWGGTVFTSQNPQQGWDGTHMRTQADCTEGVYMAIAKVTNPRGEVKEYREFVTLVR